jgi:hypothetical protein
VIWLEATLALLERSNATPAATLTYEAQLYKSIATLEGFDLLLIRLNKPCHKPNKGFGA